MKVEYLVTFDGVIPKYEAALDKMLRDDIAGYPARQKMDGATVERVDAPKPKPKPKPRAKARAKPRAKAEVRISAGSRVGKSERRA